MLAKPRHTTQRSAFSDRLLARVTWLLAVGPLVRAGPPKLTVPVFLGDAMQWNLRRFVDRSDVAIEVPGEARPLRIPLGFAEQAAAFDLGLGELNRGLEEGATPKAVGQALGRIEGATPADADLLAETFAQLQALYRAGRNGIWTFVFRNLVRPVWLSREEQRADVVVGNPPWIVYRHLIKTTPPGYVWSTIAQSPKETRRAGAACGPAFVHCLVLLPEEIRSIGARRFGGASTRSEGRTQEIFDAII